MSVRVFDFRASQAGQVKMLSALNGAQCEFSLVQTPTGLVLRVRALDDRSALKLARFRQLLPSRKRKPSIARKDRKLAKRAKNGAP